MNDRRSPHRATEPAPRSRSGTVGRHHPRTGTEPVRAQSALRLRLLLSAVFLPLFLAGAAYFGQWAAGTGTGDSPGRGMLVVIAVVCAALALLAAADLLVVIRRLRSERGTPVPH
ncbi:DUF6343 family protein [Streptomyces sp. CCM_MD2014]|uniref:DUF6343 family protein n=1 Tax=Streptomyces sp. CCM_MD2014 TaxID=1561022 RepID=UPI00052AB670|nr:DUF6343 family protein [Streptomyces sp. CCM_MD2014]AIV32635.1 hypothetical protein NI25_03070 [Streptomyces sp. CCM_MD2014]